jgi:hypothetical protein
MTWSITEDKLKAHVESEKNALKGHRSTDNLMQPGGHCSNAETVALRFYNTGNTRDSQQSHRYSTAALRHQHPLKSKTKRNK